jgi:cobalt-zinc-cadmium efflux system protein
MNGHEHGPRGGHGHAHGAAPDADWRWLAAAAALIVAFMAGEVVAGLVAHSLALLSDAAHMLTDAAAIGLALVTARVAGRPARGRYTYGLRRLEILSAQANGITLVLLAIWLAYEAVRRLITPHSVEGGLILGVALVGVVVNLAASWLLARANGASGRRSLNLEGALAHVLTDLYAFIATAAAAVVIIISGFNRADPIATLVVVVLMLYAGAGLIRKSGRIFLEAAPAGLDPAALGAAMAARPHVAEVHDLHIWEITTEMPAASAHVLVQPRQDCHAVRADLEELLSREYGISHLTLQVDHLADAAARGAAPGASPEQGHRSQPAAAAGRQWPCDGEWLADGDRKQGDGDSELDSADHQQHLDKADQQQHADKADHQAGDAADQHWTDESHSLHCEDSHGPAYRPARDG